MTPRPLTDANRVLSLRHLAGAVFVLWAVATLTFFAMRLIPGDPAAGDPRRPRLAGLPGGPGAGQAPRTGSINRFSCSTLMRCSGAWHRRPRHLVRAQGSPSAILLAAAGTLLLAVSHCWWRWAIAIALASGRRGRADRRSRRPRHRSRRGRAAAFLAGDVADRRVQHQARLAAPRPTGTSAASSCPCSRSPSRSPAFWRDHAGEHARRARPSRSWCRRGPAERARLGVRPRHAIRHAAIPGVALSGWAFGSLLCRRRRSSRRSSPGPGLGRTLMQAVTVARCAGRHRRRARRRLVYVLMTLA